MKKLFLLIFFTPVFSWGSGNITITGAASGGGAGTITGVTAGTGLSGGGTSGTVTVNVANTGVTAGTYGSASNVSSVTVNAQGQVTGAANVPILISTTGLSATGATGSNFLKSDNTWATPVGGSGGYAVEPATVTFQLNKGVTASTMTVSTLTVTNSLSITSGSTFNTVAGSTASFSGSFLDSTASAGTAGQIWTSSGPGIAPTWATTKFVSVMPAVEFQLPSINTPYISQSTNEASGAVYFDETSTQAATSRGTVLSPYAGGTLFADLLFTSTATTGTINWGAYVDCKTPQVTATNYDTDSYGVLVSSSVTVNSNSNALAKATIQLSATCIQGDVIRLKIEREAQLSDTAVGYGKLRFLRVYER